MVQTRPSISTVFSVSALIAALLTASLVVVNISSTQPITPYDFMFYPDPTNPSNYISKFGNGTIYQQGTNASGILESTIAIGGWIQLLADNYTFTSGLNVNTQGGFVLAGSSRGGYLVGTHPRLTTNLIKDFDGDFFNFYPTATTWNVDNTFTLRNFEVTSDGVHTGDIFDMNFIQEVTFENLKVTKINGTGIKINGGTAMSFYKVRVDEVYGANYGLWFNNTNDWQAFYLESNANPQNDGYSAFYIDYSDAQIFGGHFEGFNGVQIGSHLVGEVLFDGTQFSTSRERGVIANDTQAAFNNCYFLANNDDGYIDEFGAELYINANYVTVSNSKFTSVDATYSIYGVTSGSLFVGNEFRNDVTVTGTGNHFVGSNFFSADLAIGGTTKVIGNYVNGAISVTASDNTIESNSLFITENSGFQTIALGTSELTYASGLSGRPLYDFTLAWKEPVLAGWYWTSNSTHITVYAYDLVTGLAKNADGDGWSFTWQAKYQVQAP